MSKLASDFMDFLLEKHKLTGKNDFAFIDYMGFNGYQQAIIELNNLGIIENTNDILGTIIVHPPESR